MRNLYRFLATMVAAVFVSAATCGVVSAKPTWEIGVKAGMNVTKLRGDLVEFEEESLDLGGGYILTGTETRAFDELKLGFVGGAYAALHINKQLGIRLEGFYSQKGGTGKNSGSLDLYDPRDTHVATIDVGGDNTVTLDYFEIPLLAVVSFPITTSGTFDLFAGPAVAFNSKAEVEVELTTTALGETRTEKQKTNLKDDIEGTDFGGVLGAGVTYELTAAVLFAEARMTYGFKDVDKVEDSEIKNSAFGFIVGVRIPLAQSR